MRDIEAGVPGGVTADQGGQPALRASLRETRQQVRDSVRVVEAACPAGTAQDSRLLPLLRRPQLVQQVRDGARVIDGGSPTARAARATDLLLRPRLPQRVQQGRDGGRVAEAACAAAHGRGPGRRRFTAVQELDEAGGRAGVAEGGGLLVQAGGVAEQAAVLGGPARADRSPGRARLAAAQKDGGE